MTSLFSVRGIDYTHGTYRVIMYMYNTCGHWFYKNGNMYLYK